MGKRKNIISQIINMLKSLNYCSVFLGVKYFLYFMENIFLNFPVFGATENDGKRKSFSF
jgi:hypothetical protein